MKDRISTQVLANGAIRYAEYDSNGNFVQYRYMLPADEPTEVGSALNKENLLPDEVATDLGLTGDPQVKDALSIIVNNFVDTRKYYWGKYAEQFPLAGVGSAYLSNVPSGYDAFNFYYANSFTYDSVAGTYTLVNPQLIAQSAGNWGVSKATIADTIKGKYCTINGTTTSAQIYKVSDTPNIQISTAPGSVRIDLQSVVYNKTYVENVWSYNATGYPNPGSLDGFYYAPLGKPSFISPKIVTGTFTVPRGGEFLDIPCAFAPMLAIVAIPYSDASNCIAMPMQGYASYYGDSGASYGWVGFALNSTTMRISNSQGNCANKTGRYILVG